MPEALRGSAAGVFPKDERVIDGVTLLAAAAEAHRTRIMKNLELKETAGLVRYALREGMTQL